MGLYGLERYIEENKFSEPLYVTRPMLPDLSTFENYLESVWKSRWLTNEAYWHQRFNEELKKYLRVENLVLFCNGTLALLVALKLYNFEDGEIITTPFTFPATPHVIAWNGLKTVFCDIDPETFNLDPRAVERAITEKTRAIVPVHVYGLPCDVTAFEGLSRKYSLPIVYDSAHTFGCFYKGKALCSYGDLSVLSFHATKLFTTAEGGALVCHSKEQERLAYYLKNFGIADEETVVGLGINGKMSELSACLGLAGLPGIQEEISRRKKVYEIYLSEIGGIPGIRTAKIPDGLEWNYAYFPIKINAELYGIDRDELYRRLRACNVIVRKYFYPLCSKIEPYSMDSDTVPYPLDIAEEVANSILCLPMYGDLSEETVRKVCELIREFPQWKI
ncbi:MAG: DegT/DnrJ/EryC1/StrS family aminotransferase [Candidatus Hydrogenedentes bacterium]|nr:DegT/DnrJ/EryC1/StrS family aminotransferase [Candidatus Hydrogenedentota bacterium]